LIVTSVLASRRSALLAMAAASDAASSLAGHLPQEVLIDELVQEVKPKQTEGSRLLVKRLSVTSHRLRYVEHVCEKSLEVSSHLLDSVTSISAKANAAHAENMDLGTIVGALVGVVLYGLGIPLFIGVGFALCGLADYVQDKPLHQFMLFGVWVALSIWSPGYIFNFSEVNEVWQWIWHRGSSWHVEIHMTFQHAKELSVKFPITCAEDAVAFVDNVEVARIQFQKNKTDIGLLPRKRRRTEY